MNEVITIGHNNPPDPIDEAVAPFGDAIAEAETWLDGSAVESEGQLKAVDALLKDIKAALKDVKDCEASAAKPLHDAWKAEKARWKPTIDDLDRIKVGLVALGADFKKRLAAQKEAERREAERAAAEARKEAEAKAKAADLASIEEQREAAAAMDAARIAQEQAAAAAKEAVKGLRKTHHHEITDMRAALHWIARNDKPAVEAFVSEYVRRNFKETAIDGVRAWITKEAF